MVPTLSPRRTLAASCSSGTGVKRHGLSMDVKHIIELLDESYAAESRWRT